VCGIPQQKITKDIDINKIKRLCECESIRWTEHALQRLIKRNIRQEDVKYSLQNGDVIEQYLDDYPYPSCLILGILHNNTPLHVVCGIGNDELWIITTYYPNTMKWKEDFKTRIAGRKNSDMFTKQIFSWEI